MVSHDLLPAKSGIFLDATYVPLYIQTLIWLATQPAEMLGKFLHRHIGSLTFSKSSRTTALKSLIKKPGLMPKLIAFTQRSIVF
jgi:hypothetical protein